MIQGITRIFILKKTAEYKCQMFIFLILSKRIPLHYDQLELNQLRWLLIMFGNFKHMEILNISDVQYKMRTIEYDIHSIHLHLHGNSK